jgi:MFS family permease
MVGITEFIQQESIFYLYGYQGVGANFGSAKYEIAKAIPGLEKNFGIISGLDCYISAFAGMFAGVYVDKYNRRNLLAGAIILCSLSSILTGSVSSVAMICAMRLVLGAAQSAFMPAVYSLI